MSDNPSVKVYDFLYSVVLSSITFPLNLPCDSATVQPESVNEIDKKFPQFVGSDALKFCRQINRPRAADQ